MPLTLTTDCNRRDQVGSENKYLLRFEAGPNGKIREDRVFNTQQRLDSYAGRKITRRVEYVPLDRGDIQEKISSRDISVLPPQPFSARKGSVLET